MNRNVGTKIALGFAVTLAIFLLVGVTTYRSNLDRTEASNAYRETADVVGARDDLSLAARGVGLALRTYMLTGTPEHLRLFGEAVPAAEKALLRLLALQVGGAVQRQLMERLSTQFNEYLSLARRIADTRRERGVDDATRLLQDDATKRQFERLGAAMTEVGRIEEAALERKAAEADLAADRARWTILLGTAIAFAAAAVAGWLLTRDISGPLRRLTDAAERITVGDLGTPIPASGRRDEIGLLARSLQRMTASLGSMAGAAGKIADGDLRHKVSPLSSADVLGRAFERMSHDLGEQIGRLRQAALQLGSAASEVVASSSQLAASSSQTAEAVTETTATVEEVRQTAHLASQKARKVSEGAKRVLEVSDDGLRSVREVETGMGRIRAQMEAIAGSMERLSEQTRAIGQIIASVEDLATQSNLLAVNAAIEAAKAGEHGRGFAVVAHEVRALADQSRQAIQQVRTMLSDIQQATDVAVSASGQGVKVVDVGVRQAETAGSSLSTMAASIQEAIQASLQIAASSQQQLVGMDQVVVSMNSIRQASGQNLDSASKLESAARTLSGLGAELGQMIGRYRV